MTDQQQEVATPEVHDKQGEFLTNMRRFYKERFSDRMPIAMEKGIDVDPVIKGRRRGSFIALQLGSEDRVPLAGIAKRTAEVVQNLVSYDDPSILHTTFADAFVIDEGAPAPQINEEDVLVRLRAIARDVAEASHPITCKYLGVAFNFTTVVAMLEPDAGFLETAEMVVEKGRAFGLPLKVPQMAHITLARFGQVGTPEEAQALAKVCEAATEQLAEKKTAFRNILTARFKAGQDGFHLVDPRPFWLF